MVDHNGGSGTVKKRVTRRDIAEMVGVSGTVVSDVLNRNPRSRISEKTRLKVIQAAEELNYHPHGIAKRLVSGRIYHLSFAIYDLATIVYQPWSRILLGISTAADEYKYAVDLAVTSESHHGHDHFYYSRKIEENLTEGLIIYDSVISAGEIRENMIQRGLPVVLVDRKVEDLNVPSVCNDYHLSMTQIVDYIRALEHRNWAFVHFENLNDSFYNYTQMKEALSGLWKAQGERSPLNCLTISHNEAVDSTPKVRDFLDKHPETTCLICWTDGAAARINKALANLGKRVPEDISLVGVNDDLYCDYLRPSLTSVDIQRELMGQYAAEILIQMIEGQKPLMMEKLVSSKLIIRDSAGRAPASLV